MQGDRSAGLVPPFLSRATSKRSGRVPRPTASPGEAVLPVEWFDQGRACFAHVRFCQWTGRAERTGIQGGKRCASCVDGSSGTVVHSRRQKSRHGVRALLHLSREGLHRGQAAPGLCSRADRRTRTHSYLPAQDPQASVILEQDEERSVSWGVRVPQRTRGHTPTSIDLG